MTQLLHELITTSASRTPQADAVAFRSTTYSYERLAGEVEQLARGLLTLGLDRSERVAIYLPKTLETVVGIFATSQAGGVFVPVNPVLKAEQVAHILKDCNARILITSAARARDLAQVLEQCHDLRAIVLTDDAGSLQLPPALLLRSWPDVLAGAGSVRAHRNIDADVAAILYTSGSTGRPKGVVLSHRNMVTGALSVAQYLENSPSDRLLAVLPFSFDYGFSQMSTAFHVGACVVLLEYLLPRDVITAAVKARATGIAGVPPLWSQLAALEWPAAAREHVRYITNSGGAMPGPTLAKLRSALPGTKVFLMYGLTEAFRSTFLPPEQVDKRPDSIGKAIPNAEIMVVRPDGTPCAPNEPGELVHRGSLVALGYWNDPAKTAERYKPVPNQDKGLVLTELAVWSGDTVRMDEEGYLYYIGRRDEMIKTSGYRVSPTEIEEVVFASGLVADAVAVGVPHATLGQAIVVVAAAQAGAAQNSEGVLDYCRKQLANFMVPAQIQWRDALPRNPNGKYDRTTLAAELKSLFDGSAP
ncbi:MAG TPA: acyl-CoA ligase (AMP-forming), exosortase A system-associated [Steroidobacteraceae bacterium]|nr:acyl-CoA ligase (AMP-forming), exosortase A system-associated [Steroidobacteraceae bacterium]